MKQNDLSTQEDYSIVGKFCSCYRKALYDNEYAHIVRVSDVEIEFKNKNKALEVFILIEKHCITTGVLPKQFT